MASRPNTSLPHSSLLTIESPSIPSQRLPYLKTTTTYISIHHSLLTTNGPASPISRHKSKYPVTSLSPPSLYHFLSLHSTASNKETILCDADNLRYRGKQSNPDIIDL
ncbi:hypothetical protein E2C01_014860 [Portunus trituberculatus]|uniref:Uncharacterized protein n=1 Tax=Portunus trituberculatus TaxID=210409 RepID=A0A5B7DL73_PORTR|nr:hypothetical protein [Portunus trituberculatus]